MSRSINGASNYDRPNMPTKKAEEFDAWIKRQIATTQEREHALPAFACFQRLKTQAQLSVEDLFPIVLGARATAEVEWSPAVDYLFELAARHESARWVLAGLSTSRKLIERLKVVASIPATADPTFSQPLLAAALHDKSARIRKKAGWMCLAVGGRGLVDLLDSQIAIEHDSKTGEWLRRCRDLLKDGYHLERNENDTFELTVLTKQPGISTQTINAADRNDPQRLQALIRKEGS
jgi:hypothetical protein